MKTLLQSTNSNLGLFCVSFGLFLVGVTNAFAQPNPRFSSVDPVNDEVTITNYGNVAIDLQNYWLCLRPQTYERIGTITPVSGIINLMPGASVTLPYDIDPAGDGLGLYNRAAFSSAAALDDFMQWKEGGTIREVVAVDAGIWTEGAFIDGGGPYTYTGEGPQEGLAFWDAAIIGGTLSGGPFQFTVDGTADMIPAGGITLEGASGTNMGWVITDSDLNILGLPETLADVENVDFDGAGTGVCLIWHISHDGTLDGAVPMMSNAADLTGNFDLSNPITVIRSSTNEVVGGTLTGGPFEFCVGDDVADMIPAGSITLEGAVGDQMGWVITDAELNILGLPPTLEAIEQNVDFDGAGAGTCLVWHISHDGSLAGAMMGANAADLLGNFSLSNSIEVVRVTGSDCDSLSTSDFDTNLPVTIFPVPASAELQVSLTEFSANVTLEVFNMLGQKVLQKTNVSSTNASINVSELALGNYMLAVENGDGGRAVKRFTVVK